MNAYTNLAARVLLAQVFLLAGINKIIGYAGTQAYMASAGLPGSLLPLVILLEVGGAIALIVGYRTRLMALALAAFSVVSALVFHLDLGNSAQVIALTKNLALAGGLLALAQTGATILSLDNLLGRRA